MARLKGLKILWSESSVRVRPPPPALLFWRSQPYPVNADDYAKAPLTAAELKDLFADQDPRDFLNSRSPAFKAMDLTGKSFTPEQAIALIAKEPNLIKRPIVGGGK